MSSIGIRVAMHCAALAAFAVPLASNAAAPAAAPKHIPYQAPVQTDVTRAYEYRTRIDIGKPGCQRFATEADAVFLDAGIVDEAKVERLKKIGAEAKASGCLAP